MSSCVNPASNVPSCVTPVVNVPSCQLPVDNTPTGVVLAMSVTVDSVAKLDGASIDYGVLDLDEPEVKTYRITNSGTLPLFIESITLVASDFSFSSAPSQNFQLEPGEFYEFDVEAESAEEGTDTGILTIRHNAPDNVFQLSLTAEFVLNFIGDFSYESYEGTGTLYGHTEFGDLSDPPKKYLINQSNRAGFSRSSASLTPNILETFMRGRSVYLENGSHAGDDYGQNDASVLAGFGPWNGNVSPASPNGGPYGGIVVQGTPSYEDYDYSPQSQTAWASYLPNWVRTKREKYFTSWNAAPGETVSKLYGHIVQSTGVNGTGMGMTITHPVWVGNHWEITVISGSSGFSGIGQRLSTGVWMRLITGDRDPGTVTTSDIFLLRPQNTFANQGGSGASVTVEIPPDTSVRFMFWIGQDGNDHDPKQFPRDFSESGLTVVEESKDWFYFPATEGELEAWRYKENLYVEDTPPAAIARGTGVAGTESVAECVTFSGGVTAGSVSPISVEGISVIRHQTFASLTPGRRYQWTTTYETSNDNFASSSTHQETGIFDATAVTEDVDITFFAPLLYKRRIASITLEDIGATPVAPADYNGYALVWYAKALAAGGNPTLTHLQHVSDLADELLAVPNASRTRYFMPLAGDDIATQLTPLFDRLNFGRPTNLNFVDADCSHSTGLQGDGSTKRIEMPFKYSQLGVGTFGVGIYALDSDPSGSAGSFVAASWNSGSTQRAGIEIADTYVFFLCGNGGAFFSRARPTVVHSYGQRQSSTARMVYEDGVLLASPTSSNTGQDTGDFNAFLLGDNFVGSTRCGAQRIGAAYWTNGFLSDSEEAAIHAAIDNFLTASGRI